MLHVNFILIKLGKIIKKNPSLIWLCFYRIAVNEAEAKQKKKQEDQLGGLCRTQGQGLWWLAQGGNHWGIERSSQQHLVSNLYLVVTIFITNEVTVCECGMHMPVPVCISSLCMLYSVYLYCSSSAWNCCEYQGLMIYVHIW